MGGIAIHHDLATSIIAPQKIGDFEEGEINSGGGRGRQIIAEFPMHDWGGSLPKISYPVKIFYYAPNSKGKIIKKSAMVRLPIFSGRPDEPEAYDLFKYDKSDANRYPFTNGKIKLSWPQFVGALLFLAEKDIGGGFDSFLKKVLPKVKKAANKVKNRHLARLKTGISADLLHYALTPEKSEFRLSDGDKADLKVDAFTAGGPSIGDDISRPVIVSRTLYSFKGFTPDERRNSPNHFETFHKASKGISGFDGKYHWEFDWERGEGPDFGVWI